MKFISVATFATLLAFTTTAFGNDAAAPTAPVVVSPSSIQPVFGQIASLINDVRDLVQNAETIYPLIVGDNSIPAEIKELITDITKTSKDVGTLVHDVSKELNSTIGVPNWSSLYKYHL